MAGDDKKSGDGHKAGGDHGMYGRRKLPYSPYTLAFGGLVIAATIYYLAKYAKNRPAPPRNDPRDATRATTNKPEDSPPRRYT
ncbi:hypothetical protein RHMOL_Rhmol07G0212300 [Rhododendron molle]|uniref:Uncharacterized protein n=1 Tax=Rhododendron molle TaxID=49168 RepID=A0ACC0N3F5_RHOML|nr:hypothetical protein RHMOL_Rhmol07G0212300 [Rhododendron molle]